MSLYVRLFCNFYTHRKTAKLRSLLGDDALWIPPRLWAYAAENQPDGDFSKYSDKELALLIGYNKDASSMLQALLQAGFMDSDMKVHNWMEHNGYHQVFADRARKAARAKWEKERTKEKEKTEKTVHDTKGNEASIASSMLQASRSTTPTGLLLLLRAKVNKLFKRLPTESWSYAEESELYEVSKRPSVMQELDLLIAYEKREVKYFPRSVHTLLSDWQKHLDSARRPSVKANGKPAEDHTMQMIDNISKGL